MADGKKKKPGNSFVYGFLDGEANVTF